MAVGISFYLAYSKAYIKAKSLDASYVTIRCEVKYTPDALPWAISRALGRTVGRLQFAIGIAAMPKYWAKGRVKAQHPDAPAINARIDAIANRTLQLHAAYVAAGQIPAPAAFILEILGREEAATINTLHSDYERYIAYCKGRTSLAFVKSQELTLRRLMEFDTYRRRTTRYADINKTWASEFAEWLPTARRKIAVNTAGKHLKCLRMFLNHATNEGWNTSLFYKQIKIKETRDAFPLSLEEHEVAAIWQITEQDLLGIESNTERKATLITRDWFVFATQTALRFSDWDSERLKISTDSHGNHNLRLYQRKTITPVEIPLSTLALRVLAKNNGVMPKAMSASATLKHIATLCRVAGIRKKVTSHTARRTFATLQEKAGVARSTIMRITGHRSEKDYLKYVGVTFEHNAEMLRKANPAWFKSEIA